MSGFRLVNHTRYPVDAYDGEVTIDISSDDGGWSGCGHSDICLTREDLVAMIDLIDAAAKVKDDA